MTYSVCGEKFKGSSCPKCGMPAYPKAELQKRHEEYVQIARERYTDAVNCVVSQGYATSSLLQRRLKVSYPAAATMIDMMEQNGVVGPYDGDNPRKVLVSPSSDTFEQSFPAESDEEVVPHPTRPDDRSPAATRSPRKHERMSLSKLDRMDGHSFEHACSKILLANGFSHVKVTQASGDYGIDVLASRDGQRYAIQCKCYNSPVGNHAIEEAYAGAAYYDGRIPVVMTNQGFTNAALQMASKLNVLLWGRNELQKMLIVYNNVPLWKRALLFILKLLFGSVSSFISTIICLYGLYNSFLSFELQRLPSDLFYCVATWLILKGILMAIGKKILHK